MILEDSDFEFVDKSALMTIVRNATLVALVAGAVGYKIYSDYQKSKPVEEDIQVIYLYSDPPAKQ